MNAILVKNCQIKCLPSNKLNKIDCIIKFKKNYNIEKKTFILFYFKIRTVHDMVQLLQLIRVEIFEKAEY